MARPKCAVRSVAVGTTPSSRTLSFSCTLVAEDVGELGQSPIYTFQTGKVRILQLPKFYLLPSVLICLLKALSPHQHDY
jgi:hypothetical protein